MRSEGVLDLTGVHVLAAGDDHVLHAVDEVQVAVLVEPACVSRVIPATGERGRRFLRSIPVLPHVVPGPRAPLPPRSFHAPPLVVPAPPAPPPPPPPGRDRAVLFLDRHDRPGAGAPGRGEDAPAPPVLLGAEAGEQAAVLGHAIALEDL